MKDIKDSPRAHVRVTFDGRVHKTYRGKNADQRFTNEVRILRHLERRGCDHVPKLLEADEDTLTIVTTNCGQMAPRMRKEKMEGIFQALEDEYGVRHDDPFDKNITYRFQDNRFCIIDFELAEIVGEGTAPQVPDEEDESDLAKEEPSPA